MEGAKQKILVALSRKLEVAHQAYLKSLRGAQFEVLICESADEFVTLAGEAPALFVIGTKTKFKEVTGHELIRRLGELDPTPSTPALILQDPSVSVSKLPETSLPILQRWSQAREALGLTQPRSVAKSPPKIVHKQVNIESTDPTLDMALKAPKGSPDITGGDDLLDPGDLSDFSPLAVTKPTATSSSAPQSSPVPESEDGLIELTENDRLDDEKLSKPPSKDEEDSAGGTTEDLPFGVGLQSPSPDSSSLEPEEPKELSPDEPDIPDEPSLAQPEEPNENIHHEDPTEDIETPEHLSTELPEKDKKVVPKKAPPRRPVKRATEVLPAVQPSGGIGKFVVIGIVGAIMAAVGFGIIYFTGDENSGLNQGDGTISTPSDPQDGGPVDLVSDGAAVEDAGSISSDSGESVEEEANLPGGKVLPIKFRRHSYDPRTVNRRELREIVKMIKSNPSIRFELIGYASSDESRSRAELLGLRRAKRARDVICLHGPSRTRFKTTSAGATNPIIDDTGQEYFEKSRRVEIRVLDEE